MLGHIKVILFIVVGAMTAKYSVHGTIHRQVIDLWPYSVTEKSLPIEEYYKKYMKNTDSDLEGLIKKNPALEKLMGKAKGLLQMRLLQWADVVGQMALIDQQLSKYVKEGLQGDSDLLLEYAQWIVSHDHTAVTGLMEEMRKLVRPVFTSQGVLQLALKCMKLNTLRAASAWL